MLSGLDSIAMAVAHLENQREGQEVEAEAEPRQVTASSFARGSSSESSSPQEQNNPESQQRPPVPPPRSFPPTAATTTTTTVHPLAQQQQQQHPGHYHSYQPVPTAVSQSPESVPVHPTAAAAAGWSHAPSAAVSQHPPHPLPLSSPSDRPPLGVTPEGEIIMEELKALLQQQASSESTHGSSAGESAAVASTDPTATTTSLSSNALQPNDVLCGRGGETNHHSGNIRYRSLVKACQPAYILAKRRHKPKIATEIVLTVRQRGGRFLKKDSAGNWKDVGNLKAREKTSQALREGAPELRDKTLNNNNNPSGAANQQQQQQQQASSTASATGRPASQQSQQQGSTNATRPTTLQHRQPSDASTASSSVATSSMQYQHHSYPHSSSRPGPSPLPSLSSHHGEYPRPRPAYPSLEQQQPPSHYDQRHPHHHAFVPVVPTYSPSYHHHHHPAASTSSSSSVAISTAQGASRHGFRVSPIPPMESSSSAASSSALSSYHASNPYAAGYYAYHHPHAVHNAHASSALASSSSYQPALKRPKVHASTMTSPVSLQTGYKTLVVNHEVSPGTSTESPPPPPVMPMSLPNCSTGGKAKKAVGPRLKLLKRRLEEDAASASSASSSTTS